MGLLRASLVGRGKRRNLWPPAAGASTRQRAQCRLRDSAARSARSAARDTRGGGAASGDNGAVIHDADRCLEAWLGSMLPPGTSVRFDAPDPEWARRRPERPFVDVFLYDIAEDTDGMTADSTLVRDPGGRGVAWQPPVRRYRLSYLLTAWSADVSADHELLGSVMAGCAAAAIIPADCLRGTLLEAGLPVQLRCAPPSGGTGSQGMASTAGLCQALGVPPRAALTLVMVAPVIPAASADVAPAARSLDLNMAASAGGAAAAARGAGAAAREAGAAATAHGAAAPRQAGAPEGQPPLPPRGQRRWERARITERPK
jgi:hypothetical protein